MKRNVAGMERIASLLLAGVSFSRTFKANNTPQAKAIAGAAGLALLWRGTTGNCPIYSKMDFSTHIERDKSLVPAMLDRSILVNRLPDEVSRFLEENDSPLGRFKASTDENEFLLELDQRHWTLKLSPHADGQRTLIKATWREIETSAPKDSKDSTPLEKSLVPPTAERILDLRKVKSLIETGEIATIDGQSHGQRSTLGSLIENYGDRILEKIQSKTSVLLDEIHLPHNEIASKRSSTMEASPKTRAQA